MSKSKSAIKLLVSAIENQCLDDYLNFDVIDNIDLNNQSDNYIKRS